MDRAYVRKVGDLSHRHAGREKEPHETLPRPLSSSIELYPSFDYYFVTTGDVLGFSGDLKFRAPGGPLYFGGGLNILTRSGNSDTGFDLFGRFETRYGQSHPYIEARALFHDTSSLQLLFGINITLY